MLAKFDLFLLGDLILTIAIKITRGGLIRRGGQDERQYECSHTIFSLSCELPPVQKKTRGNWDKQSGPIG